MAVGLVGKTPLLAEGEEPDERSIAYGLFNLGDNLSYAVAYGYLPSGAVAQDKGFNFGHVFPGFPGYVTDILD